MMAGVFPLRQIDVHLRPALRCVAEPQIGTAVIDQADTLDSILDT